MNKSRSQQLRNQDRANVWSERIEAAQKYYRKWAQKFHVDDLEQAYYGFQWGNHDYDKESELPYVKNMIFTNIDIRMPSMMFGNSVFNVVPKPSKIDFDPAAAFMRARLKESVINTLTGGVIKDFSSELEDAITDAHFRFGIIEVGYSADFIHNPNAGKPYLVSETRPITDKDGKVIKQPEFLIEEEQIYVRRIRSERFRVGGIDQANLSRCSWYGYYDFIKREDLLAAARTNKDYNKEAIESKGSWTPDSTKWTSENKHILDSEDWVGNGENDVIAVWKIWDNRSKMMWMFTFDVDDIIYSEPFKRIRHFPLKFRNTLRSWYPVPPVFNWISPQAEVNEVRESARIHRRRFVRKYIVRKDAFDEEELEKLRDGEDGTIAFANVDPTQSHSVLQSPNLNGQHDQSLVTSTQDFNEVSGISSEQRGQSDRSTATQTQIKERRASIRESRDKFLVGNWYCDIAKEILKTAKEELALPFWVKVNADGPDLFSETTALQQDFQLITSDDFGDEDFEVNIKVSSLSPLDQTEEKNRLVEFLSLVSEYPTVAMSPTMIREIALRTGFSNERAIAEYVQMAQMLQTNQIMQLALQSGQDPATLFLEMFMRNAAEGRQNPVAQRTVAQMTPPNMEQIRNQISNQIVQPQQG